MTFYKRLMAHLERLAADKPVELAFGIAITAAVAVVGASWHYWSTDFNEFLKNVLVEAHGMVFDLFVIGWFVFWLNKRAEKRLNIQRYQEEIDDYRNWREEEATHRIVGNIKRLNQNGISQIDLSGSYLRMANLQSANLQGANLQSANLQGANLQGANLQEADLQSANLQGANLQGANLQGSILQEVNLRMSDLTGAFLQGADLMNTDFEGAILYLAFLTKIFLKDANNLSDQQLETALLCKAVLPENSKLNPDRNCDILKCND